MSVVRWLTALDADIRPGPHQHDDPAEFYATFRSRGVKPEVLIPVENRA